jgi:hypothetical protein
MAEENPSKEGNPSGKPDDELSSVYKNKGFQKMSLSDYEMRHAKKSKRRPTSIPAPLKFVGKTLFFLIFCFGIIFIPWILWVIGTHPIEKPPVDKINATK